MKLRALAAIALVFLAAPASAASYRTFRCENNTILRVIFNEEEGRATVVPFGRPSIRLLRADPGRDQFRFVRGNTHELRGNYREVRWRVGRQQRVCRRGGS